MSSKGSSVSGIRVSFKFGTPGSFSFQCLFVGGVPGGIALECGSSGSRSAVDTREDFVCLVHAVAVPGALGNGLDAADWSEVVVPSPD